MKRIALGLVLAASGLLAAENAAPPPKHVRLLAIGNSFSGNATHYLPSIVTAAGDRLTLRTISIGGCPLSKHWANAEAFQQGSTNKDARAWSVLTAEDWDFITIQQASMYSFKPETYHPFANKLHAYIRQQRPRAEILVHETWAYRADDPLFKDGFTQQDMHAKLRAAYQAIARELGCRLLPVGDAFENARRDSSWGGIFPDPRFDPKNAKPPALPDQTRSLNVGYFWSGDTLQYDGHHASTAGEYLAGAVWYEFMFGRSVVGNPFVPPGMTATNIATLQRIAHETVTGERASK
jgi:hypothetical protein